MPAKLLVTALITLGACAPRPDAPPASDSATAGAPAADAPSEAATAAGVGKYRIGSTLASMKGEFTSVTGNDTLQADCDYVRGRVGATPLFLMISHDTLVRIDIRDSTLATAAGIRVGSTESEVRRAYPDVSERPHKYVIGKYLMALADERAGVLFETDSVGLVTSYRVGWLPYLRYIEGCS